MGYKVLGFVVWQVGKWYVRRKFTKTARRAAVAGVGALVVGGAVVAARSGSK